MIVRRIPSPHKPLHPEVSAMKLCKSFLTIFAAATLLAVTETPSKATTLTITGAAVYTDTAGG